VQEPHTDRRDPFIILLERYPVEVQYAGCALAIAGTGISGHS
jgi:hypothetical protein